MMNLSLKCIESKFADMKIISQYNKGISSLLRVFYTLVDMHDLF